MVTPADLALIEEWAASRFPTLREEGSEVVVRPRGIDVAVIERWGRPGTERQRQIVKFRHMRKTGMWSLHWAVGGGRWLPDRPEDGPLELLLGQIELERVPV